MKKLGLIGGIVIVIVVIIAALSAGKMGETSHAFARGRVLLDASVVDSAKNIKTLFIVMSGPDRPMPLGALRKVVDSSKSGVLYEFILTRDNMQMMMGGSDVPDRFKLKARLDRDDQAGPDQPGDLVGEVTDVSRGQGDIEIVISKVIP